MKPIKLSISVMAHPSRDEFFPYLKNRLGVSMSQFSIDQKNNLLENSKSAWMLHDRTADFHVVVQDDCVVCDDFKNRAIQFISEREEARIRENRPPQGYNFFIKKANAGDKLLHPDGYYTDNCTRAGLSICLPTKMIIPMLVEFDKQFSRHDDDRISGYLRKHGYNVLFPIPCLIDHRVELASLANNSKSLSAVEFIDAKKLPVANAGEIPKIIHQLWVGGLPAPTKWMKTWKEKNPKWETVLWDNDKVKSTHWINKRLIDYYWSKKIWCGVSDVCTYEILHNHGGVMPGADSICQLPFGKLFDGGYDSYGVYEQEEIRPGLISPLLASVKGGKFAAELIDGLRRVIFAGDPWKTTGNRYMGKMYEKTQQNVKIFPSYYFNPTHLTGVEYQGTGTVYAHQMWGTTKGNYSEGVE